MIPTENLIREDTRVLLEEREDMDADGVPEIAVASVSKTTQTFGLPIPYIEVFAHREGEWRRVFDATGHAPPGQGTPPAMLVEAQADLASGQRVETLELVDFAGDDAEELVVAVSNVGATAGPLELWIVSMSDAGELQTEYYMSTERGGKVALLPPGVVPSRRVAIEFAVYKKGDPGCCPSSFEVRTIGHDPETGGIGVLERQRHPLAQP